jgi:(1->4)-alpha-D-glucan 1-alpha-D-glucosylmutase
LEQLAVELGKSWPDPIIKLWVTTRTLSLRREWPEVFSWGDYIPVAARGPAADHLLSFARHFDGQWVMPVVPRHFQRLRRAPQQAAGAPHAQWAGTQLVLPESRVDAWRCALSGRLFEPEESDGQVMLNAEQLFDVFPIALLTLPSEPMSMR